MDRELEDQAERDRKEWAKYAERLIGLCMRLEPVPIPVSDRLALMCRVYLYRQIDHMRSILRLERSRDTQLIARCMLEGATQLMWAEEDPEARESLWSDFAAIHDWRQMKMRKARGESVDDDEKIIRKNLEAVGRKFLRDSRYGKYLDPGQAIPEGLDIFKMYWTIIGPTKLFKHHIAHRGMDLINLDMWRAFSDWHHWSIGGSAQAVSFEETKRVYLSQSSVFAVLSLSAGYQSLTAVTLITDARSGGLISDDVRALDKEVDDWILSLM